ncbi:MAG TPA: hypothetical protein VFF68_13700 [Anaerolineaceae bacterium]|nr:hypothetical protein [Anaerolineaceae bacterium]
MKNIPALLLFILCASALLLGACSPAVPAETEVFGSEPAVSQTAVPVFTETAAPEEPPVATEAVAETEPAVEPGQLSFQEFDHQISLVIPPALAANTEAVTQAALEPSPDIMYVDTNPAHLRIRLREYAGGQAYQLPYPLPAAQIAVFSTEGFAVYGAEQPTGYTAQLQALQDLLQAGLAPDVCSRTVSDREPTETGNFLPFLPWLNSAQVFCAQPEIIEFEGGQGVRYLTYFSQGLNPWLDTELFYTFQGVTDDGELYVSAVLPVRSGLLPVEPPELSLNCMDPSEQEACKASLNEQLQQLNGQAGEAFNPTLAELDGVIRSLVVTK